jgi:broad specificity phosphatase PhoE
MKLIEIRRHALRRKPGPNLTQAGVDVARGIGQAQPRFQRVITSTVPRAVQTAVAMGWAVDEEVELLTTYGQAIEDVLPWPQPFAAYAAARDLPMVTQYLERLAAFYHKLLASLPEGGAALVVNHGGVAEMSAIACCPDTSAWDGEPHLECCEGVRLSWDHAECNSVEILRV